MKYLHAAFVANVIVVGGLLIGSACTTAQKATAKTAADVAAEACHFAFGEHPEELPPGVSIKDFCEAEEHLLPFVDSILSAREGIAHKLGTDTMRTRVLIHDAGTD